MPSSPSVASAIPVARRVNSFTYAIRNIVAEAKKVEAAGRAVRYLNIGDPIAVRLRDAAAPDRGGQPRDARTDRTATRRRRASPRRAKRSPTTSARAGSRSIADRVLLTSGTSEGIELTLNALVDADDEVLVPVPTYPLYTAVLAKIGAKSVFYRTDPDNGWQPDLDHIRSLITPTHARAGR